MNKYYRGHSPLFIASKSLQEFARKILLVSIIFQIKLSKFLLSQLTSF